MAHPAAYQWSWRCPPGDCSGEYELHQSKWRTHSSVAPDGFQEAEKNPILQSASRPSPSLLFLLFKFLPAVNDERQAQPKNDFGGERFTGGPTQQRTTIRRGGRPLYSPRLRGNEGLYSWLSRQGGGERSSLFFGRSSNGGFEASEEYGTTGSEVGLCQGKT